MCKETFNHILQIAVQVKSRKMENNKLIIKIILNYSSKCNKICDLAHSHITFIIQV